MRFLLICFFLLTPKLCFSQTLTISHPFLLGGFLDLGVLDPFQRCSNTVIVSNSLTCTMLQSNTRMQVKIPLTFKVTGTATPTDVRLIVDEYPIPGSRLRFNLNRNSVDIGNNSVQSLNASTNVDIEVIMNIELFGSDSTNIQAGEIGIELIIP